MSTTCYHRRILPLGDVEVCISCRRVSWAGSEFRDPQKINENSYWSFKDGAKIKIEILTKETQCPLL